MNGARPTLYLDLDGTLIDIRDKHYSVYSMIAAELGCGALTPKEYWRVKMRGAIPQTLLRGADERTICEFSRRWLSSIESSDALLMDTLISGTTEALTSLSAHARLVLVTLRRRRGRLLKQLRTLRINGFFDLVVTLDGLRPDGLRSKAQMIQEFAPPNGLAGLVVGDSEADVRAGRELGLPALCVLTGVRDRVFLEALAPQGIIDSIAELPRRVLEYVPSFAGERTDEPSSF